MPQISLYVPCYNVEPYIAGCIEGVLSQTHPLDEILIIDDGCADATVAIAGRYPVRIISHAANRGLAAARNTALSAARNDWVASLDADCVPQPNWLRCLAQHTGKEKVAAIGGRLIEVVQNTLGDCWRRAHMSQDWGDKPVINPPFMFGNDLLVRRSVVGDVGGYNERLRTNGEDADLSRKIQSRGGTTIYDPSAVVHHMRKDTAMSVLRTFWNAWSNGTQAYFGGITPRAMLRNLYYSHFRENSLRFLREDFRKRRYELIGLDMALLVYLGWRDLRLLLGQ